MRDLSYGTFVAMRCSAYEGCQLQVRRELDFFS